MPTLDQVFYILAALLFAAGCYFVRQRVRVSAKKKRDIYWKRTTGIMLFFGAALFYGLGYFNNSASNVLPPAVVDSGPAQYATAAPPAPVEQAPRPLDPAEVARKKQELDEKLAKLNDVLKARPNDAIAYGDRGATYAALKSYDLAEDDFRTALRLKPKMVKAAFDLAEMEFQQKKYDAARPGFESLKSDLNLGDLAIYKIFLCDLFGGHAATADKELDALNQQGTEASYYFANIAYFLVHGNNNDARDWYESASNIYEPYKIDLYTSSLTDLGYMPIPPKK